MKKDFLIAGLIILVATGISFGIAFLQFQLDDQKILPPDSITVTSQNPSPLQTSVATPKSTAAPAISQLTYTITETKPHDDNAFTQGLYYEDGILYEGTGLYGESILRKQNAQTGEILLQKKLPAEFFGEGIAIAGNRLFQLTWKEGKGFIYDKTTLEKIGEFTYPGEGWGLTFDGKSLIMSDGTEYLRFLNPDTFAEEKSIRVVSDGKGVKMLNELEYVNGEIYANIWQTDRIIRISPESGEVTGNLDLTGLLPAEERTPTTDVLNGIAYDPTNDSFLITGKKWPKLFLVKIGEGK